MSDEEIEAVISGIDRLFSEGFDEEAAAIKRLLDEYEDIA